MISMEQRIADRLRAGLSPTALEVANDSHRHAGHSGDDGSGESHFSVTIRAPSLAPLSRLARHRAVHAALGPEIMTAIHALAIDAA